jgi:hypothetical protein
MAIQILLDYWLLLVTTGYCDWLLVVTCACLLQSAFPRDEVTLCAPLCVFLSSSGLHYVTWDAART